MSYPCIVKKSDTKGSYVVATEPIKSGDVIIQSEAPFVWNSVACGPGQQFHKFCYECGVVLRSQMLDEIRSDLMKSDSIVGDRVLSTMTALLPLLSLAQDQTSNNSHQQLKAVDVKGHYGLACKIYARVAAETLRRVALDPNMDIAAEAVTVANDLLAEYQTTDFALTMHAYRTGRFEVDPGMFESLLFPAYFGAHLATPLALTKEIFQQSGEVLWSVGGSVPTALAAQRSDAFVSSPIFSDQFYSRVVGTFVTNCLSVHVPSPLDYILSEALAVQSGAPDRNVSQEFDPLVVDRVVEYLQARLRAQQDSASAEDTAEDSPAAATGAGARFLGMSASGLFSKFSKANHSCVCNTTNFGSDRVSVTVVATEDIPAGAEVTNCYIHHDSLNLNNHNARHDHHYRLHATCTSDNPQHVLNAQLTKKQRYRALRQYVFECDCPLCVSQEVDSDEESV